jgi:UDP-N-acetylglucosamine--N-acetylmuramyl-(pentapeptide) pyrophosphoryl-undecaprenol N-acetylglucosamine transferase
VSKVHHILIACGGTGGHLFPGVAVAEALRGRGHEVALLISEKKVDAEASAKYGTLRFHTLPAVAKPATFSPKMISFLWRLWGSLRRCRGILRETGADAVLGMGGFTSLPPVYAAHRAGLRTFIHESNARPGRANVLTSRFCSKVFLGLSAAAAFFPGRATQVTGTPVRGEILRAPARDEACARFGLDPSKPVLLVTGGSQGARRLNAMAAEAAKSLAPTVQVLHIAGAADAAGVTAAAAGNPGHVVLGFCDDMAAAYAAADLVVARSGASSLTEIAACGLPSVLVPYPFAADDHQTRNAEVFRDAGAAVLAPEAGLDAASLAREVSSLLSDCPRLATMAAAARSLAVADAAQRVCDAIESSLN